MGRLFTNMPQRSSEYTSSNALLVLICPELIVKAETLVCGFLLFNQHEQTCYEDGKAACKTHDEIMKVKAIRMM